MSAGLSISDVEQVHLLNLHLIAADDLLIGLRRVRGLDWTDNDLLHALGLIDSLLKQRREIRAALRRTQSPVVAS